jgi:hypothetical protein
LEPICCVLEDREILIFAVVKYSSCLAGDENTGRMIRQGHFLDGWKEGDPDSKFPRIQFAWRKKHGKAGARRLPESLVSMPSFFEVVTVNMNLVKESR